MKLLLKGIAIIMAVTLFSCGSGSNSDTARSSDVMLEDKAEEKKKSSDANSSTDTTTAQASSEIDLQSGSPLKNIDWDKKIIKTAHVTLELTNFQTFNSTIRNHIKRYGAYVASEQQNQSDDKIENVITIKVPVAQFEDMMNALPAEGVKLLEKRISTEDVTGEIVDTKARIQARKQVREQYLGLLKKSKSMKDILEVQKEVNAIQEDIEAGTGRSEMLAHQAAYSTINLTYFQYLTPSPYDDNTSPTFVHKIKEAFQDGASILAGLVVMIVTIWPLLLAVFIIWMILKKLSMKSVKLVKKEG